MAAGAIWVAVCLLIVPLVEFLHFAVYKYEDWDKAANEKFEKGMLKCCGSVPTFIFELYRIVGYFFVGFLFCLVTTEISKIQVGRLRPYFLTGTFYHLVRTANLSLPMNITYTNMY